MKPTLTLFCLLAFSQFIHLEGFAKSAPPAEGDPLPDIVLPVPDNPAHRNYLGLAGQGNFRIPEIDAPLIIIEIFSMYCPYCQREAPTVNQLYQSIKKRPDIKLIGIGVGNSEFEVSTFRKTFDIEFPLFADPEWTLHNQLGKCRTPYFIALKILPNGTDRIVFTQLGGIENKDPVKFLDVILKQAGMK